ncbi:hypothetical protein ACT5AA_000279 [Cronobacter sakazakii]|nr:hypothetical protein [Cronobacter sakazakii]ELY6387781.1 hypothetical protein [Cronobacter sakazakii]
MSEISKEALAAACAEKVRQLEFSVKQSAFDSVRQELETELAIARVALLALRAEPDYIRYDCGCCGWETIEDWRDNDACPKCNHKPMSKTELYAAPPAPVVADERYQQLSELYHDQEKRLFKLAQRIKGPTFDKYAHSPSQAIDELEAAIFGENDEDSRAAMLAAPAKN